MKISLEKVLKIIFMFSKDYYNYHWTNTISEHTENNTIHVEAALSYSSVSIPDNWSEEHKWKDLLEEY